MCAVISSLAAIRLTQLRFKGVAPVRVNEYISQL